MGLGIGWTTSSKMVLGVTQACTCQACVVLAHLHNILECVACDGWRVAVLSINNLRHDAYGHGLHIVCSHAIDLQQRHTDGQLQSYGPTSISTTPTYFTTQQTTPFSMWEGYLRNCSDDSVCYHRCCVSSL